MFCMHCGKELWENARFCQACGAPVIPVSAEEVTPPVPVPAPAPVPKPAPVISREEAEYEQERVCVERYCRSLKNEHLAWKIVGIVMMVRSVLLLVIAAVTTLVGGAPMLTAQSEGFWMCGVITLAVAVVNLCVAKTLSPLRQTIYADVRPVIDRYSGSGVIVLAVVFNLIAMIFVIENVSRTKSKTAVLQRIVQRQQMPPIQEKESSLC